MLSRLSHPTRHQAGRPLPALETQIEIARMEREAQREWIDRQPFAVRLCVWLGIFFSSAILWYVLLWMTIRRW